MLRKHPWLGAASILAAALALYYLSIPVLGARYAEVCSKGEYGPPDHCEGWDIVSAFVLRLLVALDEHNGIVAAFAGVLVAIFTGVLWWTTRRLWIGGERQLALAREEFEAAHRPWLAVDGPDKIIVQFDREGVSASAEYLLENFGETAAVDILASGCVTGPLSDAEIDEVQSGYLANFSNAMAAGMRKPQNQIVFPGRRDTYRVGKFTPLDWHTIEHHIKVRDDSYVFLVVLTFIYASSLNKNALYHTACVHCFTIQITQADILAGKAGAESYREAVLHRWKTGWAAG